MADGQQSRQSVSATVALASGRRGTAAQAEPATAAEATARWLSRWCARSAMAALRPSGGFRTRAPRCVRYNTSRNCERYYRDLHRPRYSNSHEPATDTDCVPLLFDGQPHVAPSAVAAAAGRVSVRLHPHSSGRLSSSHCPGRTPPFLTVKQPARPYKPAIQIPIYYGEC